jgi:hypothetical protein
MPPSDLFVDRETGAIDFDEVLAEARPVATLLLLVVAAALVPFALGLLAVEILGLFPFPLQPLFTLATQFVLAVGGGVVLLYIVARGVQLAEE